MANNGILLPSPLAAAEARPEVVESLAREHNYRAVLTRRLGSMTAHDFITNGQRLVSVCDEVYDSTEITLMAEQGVPMDEALVAASHGEYVGPEGITITTDELTMDGFQRWFDRAKTMRLVVMPAPADVAMKVSFATMEFTRQSRRHLFSMHRTALSSQPVGRHWLNA